MLKIGVLGAGHLGKIHLNCLRKLPEIYDLKGFYDPHPQTAEKVAHEFGLHRFATMEELMDAVDVVDIVTPTLDHFECAQKAFQKGKHAFIEKPITATPAQAEELIEISNQVGVKAQVGHVERFNPAFLAVRNYIQNPMFIETHRLAEFNPRGTDVPVVLDLMIHDIDIVLSIVQSPLKNVSASGVAVVSDTPDIANARLEFENGCTANLTASRISLKNMRKTRIFQKDAYVTVDFLEKQSEVTRMMDDIDTENPFAMIMELPGGKKKQVFFEQPEVPASNAILEELKSFGDAINKNMEPHVTLQDGHQALALATKILERIDENLNVIA